MNLDREIDCAFFPTEVLTEPQCNILASAFGLMTGLFLSYDAYMKLDTSIARDKLNSMGDFGTLIRLMKGVKTRNMLHAIAAVNFDLASKLLKFIVYKTFTRERFDKPDVRIVFATTEQILNVFEFNVDPDRTLDKVACRQLLMHVPTEILRSALETVKSRIFDRVLFSRVTVASSNTETMLRAFIPDQTGINPTSLFEFVGKLHYMPSDGLAHIVSAFLFGVDSYRHYIEIPKDVKLVHDMRGRIIDAMSWVERSGDKGAMDRIGKSTRFLDFLEYRGLKLATPKFDVWCLQAMERSDFSLRRVVKSIEVVDANMAGKILERLKLDLGDNFSKAPRKPDADALKREYETKLYAVNSELEAMRARRDELSSQLENVRKARDDFAREMKTQMQRAEGLDRMIVTLVSEREAAGRKLRELQANAVPGEAAIQRISIEELTGDEIIGQGSFGQVKRMRWRGAEVAVKFIELPVGDKTAEQEASDEAKLLVQLRHPCIADFYGILKHANTYGIVMGFCSRGTLFNYLKQVKLDDKRKIDISRDIASGVWYLHENNVVHRDIKSGNVMLDECGRCKIIDFGLSKMRDHLNTLGGTATKTSSNVVGTTLWMAPEIITHDDANAPVPYNKSTDMYAVGITLWEVAAQKMPYSGAKGNLGVIAMWKSMNKFDEIPGDTPKQMVASIENLRLNPAERWSAEQLYGVLTEN